MWLLDANMDVHLLDVLRESRIPCESATRLGWGELDNGALVSAAVAAGYTCLLTRDRLFGESAASALRAYPTFSIVVVELAQRPWREYQEQFRAAWAAGPIQPIAGRLLSWP